MSVDGLSDAARDLQFRHNLGLAPVTIRDLGRPAPDVDGVALRRYPFPFSAGLAICDDFGGPDEELFAMVHSEFEQRGLELGAIAGRDGPCAAGSDMAAAAQRAGLLDGAIAGATDSTLAITLGSDGGTAARYWSDDGLSSAEKFGDYSRLLLNPKLDEAFRRFDYSKIGQLAGPTDSDLLRIVEATPPTEHRALLLDIFDSPFLSLNGGLAFKRFAGPQRPALSTFAFQLRSQFLDQLVRDGAAVIIQQSFGQFALLGQSADRERRRPASPDDFGAHERIALDDLAARAADKVLVCATARLLDWLQLQYRLSYSVVRDGDDIAIHCVSQGVPSTEGLAFLLPPGTADAAIFIDGKRQDAVQRVAEPDAEGVECIYLPWERRQWPSL